jgi:hypothetical protein
VLEDITMNSFQYCAVCCSDGSYLFEKVAEERPVEIGKQFPFSFDALDDPPIVVAIFDGETPPGKLLSALASLDKITNGSLGSALSDLCQELVKCSKK